MLSTHGTDGVLFFGIRDTRKSNCEAGKCTTNWRNIITLLVCGMGLKLRTIFSFALVSDRKGIASTSSFWWVHLVWYNWNHQRRVSFSLGHGKNSISFCGSWTDPCIWVFEWILSSSLGNWIFSASQSRTKSTAFGNSALLPSKYKARAHTL